MNFPPPRHDARFRPYFGCNHEVIPAPDYYCGGGFRYKDHLGKPLTARLWEDLVHRACIRSLWVLPERGGEWCLGRGPGSATVYLDDEGNVADVYLVPHYECRQEHVPDNRPWTVEMKPGAAIGHTAGLLRAQL